MSRPRLVVMVTLKSGAKLEWPVEAPEDDPPEGVSYLWRVDRPVDERTGVPE